MSKATQAYTVDLPWILRHRSAIEMAAGKFGVPAGIIAAVLSRESGGGRLLNPPGPGGTGDAGHGRGLMQIDDRWHDFASSGAWASATANIEYGTRLLASNYLTAVKKGAPGMMAWRVALAGYNAGMGNALAGYQAGNPDRSTAGGDYSRDVLERAAYFAADFGGPGSNAVIPLILGVAAALWL